MNDQLDAMRQWALDFANAYAALADGNASLHDLLDWAYEIYPESKLRPAAEVAAEAFAAWRVESES